MRVLVVTNMYPSAESPAFGVFVEDQVISLKRQGVEVDVLFVDGRKSRLNYLRGLLRLWSHLRRNEYDLIHAHYVFSGLLARSQWKYPVVLTHHGHEVLAGWQGWLSRLITAWFDQVIVVSQQMKEKLQHPKTHVIPCGVDLERFRPAPREEARAVLGLPLEKKLVLWAGEHWRPEKRFELVQAAVALVKEEDPSVELVLLTGKPHGQVPMYMNACDVLLLASDAEGSPMVVKEAMACNLPVVAVPVGDVPQVIGETEGCYLCAQDPRDVAEKTRLVLRRRDRTRGWERVQHLSLDAIAHQVMQVYQQAVGRRPAVRTKRSSRLSSLED